MGIQTNEAKNVPKNAIPSVCANPLKIELKFQVEFYQVENNKCLQFVEALWVAQN